MGAINNGYIITTDTASLKKVNCDEKWLITRAGIDIPNTLRVRELAPSSELFSRYIKEWRGKNPEEWWPLYKEDFCKELKTEEKLVQLRKLWKLVKIGKVIALVCFCKDNRYCHRTLVGDFLREAGIDVREIGKQKKNELEYVQLSFSFEVGED